MIRGFFIFLENSRSNFGGDPLFYPPPFLHKEKRLTTTTDKSLNEKGYDSENEQKISQNY